MDHTPSAPTTAIPRPLFVYALLYGGMTVLAGVLGLKQIALPPEGLAAQRPDRETVIPVIGT